MVYYDEIEKTDFRDLLPDPNKYNSFSYRIPVVQRPSALSIRPETKPLRSGLISEIEFERIRIPGTDKYYWERKFNNKTHQGIDIEKRKEFIRLSITALNKNI